MTTPTILPCPFCGSEASLEDKRLLWVVRCSGCGACVLGDRAPEPEQELPESYWEPLRQSAVDCWNQRSAWQHPKEGTKMTDNEFNALCDAHGFSAVARGELPLVPRNLLKALVDAAVLAERERSAGQHLPSAPPITP